MHNRLVNILLNTEVREMMDPSLSSVLLLCVQPVSQAAVLTNQNQLQMHQHEFASTFHRGGSFHNVTMINFLMVSFTWLDDLMFSDIPTSSGWPFVYPYEWPRLLEWVRALILQLSFPDYCFLSAFPFV